MDNSKTHRLVWNFEFSTAKNSALSELNAPEEEIKWESRFFWSATEIITLSLLEDSLLDISHYQPKQKQDSYYLVPHHEYNIKSRRGDLLYKPLVKQGKYVSGFGAKINISQCKPEHLEFNLQEIKKQLQCSTEVLVKKDSFTYKFTVQPSIKLELARIEINNTIYFSACVEGKSRQLVEIISRGLFGKLPSCDYVHFLKKITHL